MRVLVIAPDFPPNLGGIANFVHNLCLQLVRRRHQVDVLAAATRQAMLWDSHQPYHVHRYDSQGVRLSSRIPIRQTLALHQKRRYDLIFIGSFTTTHALGAVALKILRKIPYVVLCHGNDLDYPVTTKSLDRKLFAPLMRHNASLLLGNSSYTVRRIREIGYHGPAEILHPGVDTLRFHPALSTSEVAKQVDLVGRPVLLTVSRLTKRKNLDRVLEALQSVVQKFSSLAYLIAGSGPEESFLRAKAHQLGLSSHVQFIGPIEDELLGSLYCAADAYVLPSLMITIGRSLDVEGFGMCYLEANACGKPVIGGRVGGVTDAILHGETGLLVDPTNVDAIADAIFQLLLDADLARRLGENGRRRVEQAFTWQKVGDRFESYLEQVLTRSWPS